MTHEKSPENIRDILIQTLEDNKAEDIVSISLHGKSPLADFMIIASGRSSRHVVGLSNNLDEALSKAGVTKSKFDGRENGDWVLVDTGDIIIHLFKPEVREFYNIEKIWCDPEALQKYEAARVLADA